MNPHLNQPSLHTGASLEDCQGVVLMMHGRGGSPDDMLALAKRLNLPSLAYFAPAAAGASWYPTRFMEPRESNEPYLSYALEAYDQRVRDVLAKGIPVENIALLGFSQGACLTAEYAFRHPARYGGVIIFTGALIGPTGTIWNATGGNATGGFDNTPIFLGSSDIDDWVPLSRVQETSAVFRRMGATVSERIYASMAHLVCDDEISAARTILQGMRLHP